MHSKIYTRAHTHTQVSVCPFDLLTGYTLFVEDEDRGVNALMTRADMEAHMVGGNGARVDA